MKFNQIVNSFSSGELTRLLKGRTDLEEFYKGVEDMTNFLPLKQGGAAFRPGSIAVNIPDIEDFHSVFEFTPKDGLPLLVCCDTIAVDQIKVYDARDGFELTVTKPDYIWNTRPSFADSTTANANASRTKLSAVQSGDVMVIFEATGALAPVVVMRISDTEVIVDSMLRPSINNAATGQPYLASPAYTQLRFPYKDTNINPGIKLKPSATSGAAITITAENASAAAINFFEGDVVGMWVKITTGTTTGAALITAKTSASQVTAFVSNNFGGTTASSNWEVSAWNPNDGYPTCGAFFEGRLLCAASPKYPDTIWCSLAGNIFQFMQRRLLQDASTDASGLGYYGSIKTTDPFSFIPASAEANAIQWMYPSDTLLVGSTKTEFSITGGSDESLSASAIFIKPISNHGSSKVQPIKAGSSILFVTYDGRQIREIPKRLVEYVSATELTAPAEDILDKAMEAAHETLPVHYQKLNNVITKLAWTESDSTLWALVTNSTSGLSALISLVYDRTTKTNAWSKHFLGHNEDLYIYNIISLPDQATQKISRLWIHSERGLEYIWHQNRHESMEEFYPFGDPILDDRCKQNVVHGLDYVCVPSTALVGNDLTLPSSYDKFIAFGGEAEVGVIADGNYLGLFEIQAGTKITIPDASNYSQFAIGFLYTGKIKTFPLEAGAQFGGSQGSPRRPHEIVFGLDRSRGGKYYATGPEGDRTSLDLLLSTEATAASLYSKEKRVQLNASPGDTQMIIEQNQPYPLTILWFARKGFTNDA